LGNSSCGDSNDRILSFYSSSVANSAPGELNIKKDWWHQTSGLYYVVWRDGWIDMCKGLSYPDATEFKK
jgi:hypothetical protein